MPPSYDRRIIIYLHSARAGANRPAVCYATGSGLLQLCAVLDQDSHRHVLCLDQDYDQDCHCVLCLDQGCVMCPDQDCVRFLDQGCVLCVLAAVSLRDDEVCDL